METLLEQACRPAILERGDAQALTALARTRRVEAGQQVLSRNEPAASLWLVASGRVALGTRGTAGLLQHRCSVEGGQWLDLVSALAGGGYADDESKIRPSTRGIAGDATQIGVLHHV